MFQRDLTALSTASPEQIWPLYAKVSRWSEWDEAIERVNLEGPFAAGTEGQLVMHGRPPLPFKMTEVTPNLSFADETQVGPMTVRFTHTLEPRTGGTLITHRLEVEGPGAEARGAEIAQGVEKTVVRLAKLAAAGQATRLGGVILYTLDVHTKAAFYEKAFGFKVRNAAPGNTYLQLEGAVPLAFASETFVAGHLPLTVQRSRSAEPPPGAELMVVVADVPSAFARAVEAGAVSVVAPHTMPWGQEVAYVRDDDGVLVELCTPWA